MLRDNYCVYIVYHLQDFEFYCYIGYTNNPVARKNSHFNKSTNKQLRDLISQGFYFEFEILHSNLTLKEALLLEEDLISQYTLEYGNRCLNQFRGNSRGQNFNTGELHNNSKLTDKIVADIRKEWVACNGNKPLKEFANTYNVAVVTIHNILQNKSYYDPTYYPVESTYQKRKITDQDIIEMRIEYSKIDKKYRQLSLLAQKYGITPQHAGRIVNGISFKHLTGPIKGKDYN